MKLPLSLPSLTGSISSLSCLKNKNLFKVKQTVGALCVDAQNAQLALKQLTGKGLLRIPKIPAIIGIPKDKTIEDVKDPKRKRLILLDPTVKADSIESLPTEIKSFALESEAKLISFEIELDYDYWTVEQVLRAILPVELDVPTGFATIGHIAHFNLKKEYQPFKEIIGQVVLDKNPNIRTVVNKTDNIDHTFRFFSMELLAGEDNTMAKMREGQCTFTFDFAKVYWNSKLQGEHDRIVKLFKPNQTICDVFGGVGPFALPAARNGYCTVFCNDLNPSSFEYLEKNIQSNKLGHKVAAFNMDGREFIRKSIELINDDGIWKKFEKALHFSVRRTDKAPPRPIERVKKFDHYVMNLPATATEFLDAFTGLYHGTDFTSDDLPMIHCYSFSKNKKDLEKDVIEKTTKVLGCQLDEKDLSVHKVRNVAPNKEMMCISFRLPESVAFSLKRKMNEE